MKRQEFP